MSSVYESIVIDPGSSNPLDLNPGTPNGWWIDDGMDIGMPPRRPQWIGGPEADGALLVENPPYDDANGSLVLHWDQVTPTNMDAALAAVSALTAKLQECSAAGPSGLPVSWTPANASNTYTMYWKLAEYDGPPPITPNGDLAGWFQASPTLKVKFVRDPFLYRPEMGSVTDDFSSNTIANYTADAGAAGNVSIAGGVMQAAANLTTLNRLVRTAGVTYPDLYDAQATVKATLGTTLSGFLAGVALKRVSANTLLQVYVDDNGTNSRLRIDKVVAGTVTNLASVNLAARMTTASSHWVRARIEGNVVYAEHWTSAPTPTGAIADTVSATLAGGDATQFGQGVQGKLGLVFTPQQAAASLDDFAVDPNVWVAATPILIGTLPGIPGDVAAIARLIDTDRQNQARRYIEWGIQQRYYQGLPLELDSGSLVTTGFAGTSVAGSGSYNTNVVRATLTTTPAAVCGTGNLGHVGTFRVKARVKASAATVYVRLSWQDGSGVFRANDYALPPVTGAMAEVDLGIVTITPALTGTQQWSGRIEAYGAAGDTIDVDYLVLVPAGEGYGKARGAYNYTPGAIVARDEFTGTTAGSALNGRVAPVGGTWATSGAATDFAFADAPGTDETVTRATTSDASIRAAILGASTFTDTEVSARVRYATTGTPSATDFGVVARWVDASNYARVGINLNIGFTSLLVVVVVGGTQVLSRAYYQPSTTNFVADTWYRLRTVVYASGQIVASVLNDTGATLATAVAYHSAVATGGALASGKPGLYDNNPSLIAITRYFDTVVLATPAPEPIVVNSGRSAEIRSDGAIRQDAGGTTYGPVPAYRGARFYLPPAGDKGLTSRVLVKAHRNDIETGDAANVTDNLQVQVAITPRFLLPR